MLMGGVGGGGGVNLSRLRLRVGREYRRKVGSFANDFAKKCESYNPLESIIMNFKWIIIHYIGF